MAGKPTKDGKVSNITIRVTEELREKVETLWKKDYSMIPFNSFLGYLVDKGADEEAYIAEYRAKRAEMKEREEPGIQEDLKSGENMRLDRRIKLLERAINEKKTLEQIREESSPIHGIKQKNTDAAQNAPGGMTRPPEAPGGAKPEENPIHNKKRG
jgi:uncharacterized protein (UPF0297 family)